MKGCLGLLGFMVVLALGEYVALRWTPMSGSIGLPILSSVLVTIVLANVWGLALWFKRRKALNRPPQSWRDGEFVGCSGRILSERHAIAAPASGVACAVYEYSLRQRRSKTVRQGGSTRTQSNDVSMYDGMGMSGCSVQSGAHRFRLVGFPILASVPKERLAEPDALARMAAHLLRSQISKKPDGVGDALRVLREILADADGVVRNDMAAWAAFDMAPYQARFAAEPEAVEEELTQFLIEGDCWVDEQRVPEAAEVTLYGRYRAADRSIDVGSGLDNVEHGLALGSAAQTSGSDLKRALFGLAFFGAAAWLVHAWIVPPLLASAGPEPYVGRSVGFDDALTARFDPAKSGDRLLAHAQSGEAQAIRLLTALGANPDGGSGSAPVRQVQESSALQALLDGGADPNAADHVGNTALHSYAERGDVETVRMLLAKGANPDVRNSWGSTPLAVAATRGETEVARALLDGKADPDVAANNGAAPLDNARANGHLELAQLLLEREAVETEVTARTGTPVTADHPAAGVTNAYLAAIHARDAAATTALYVSRATFDWSSIDWEAFLGGRPVRVERASGFVGDTRATLRVSGPQANGAPGYLLAFDLERVADAPADDPHGGWRIVREWIEWDGAG